MWISPPTRNVPSAVRGDSTRAPDDNRLPYGACARPTRASGPFSLIALPRSVPSTNGVSFVGSLDGGCEGLFEVVAQLEKECARSLVRQDLSHAFRV